MRKYPAICHVVILSTLIDKYGIVEEMCVVRIIKSTQVTNGYSINDIADTGTIYDKNKYTYPKTKTKEHSGTTHILAIMDAKDIYLK